MHHKPFGSRAPPGPAGGAYKAPQTPGLAGLRGWGPRKRGREEGRSMAGERGREEKGGREEGTWMVKEKGDGEGGGERGWGGEGRKVVPRRAPGPASQGPAISKVGSVSVHHLFIFPSSPVIFTIIFSSSLFILAIIFQSSYSSSLHNHSSSSSHPSESLIITSSFSHLSSTVDIMPCEIKVSHKKLPLTLYITICGSLTQRRQL